MSTNTHPTDPNPSDLNRPVTTAAGAADEHEASFAETALKLGGKSEDEARRTGGTCIDDHLAVEPAEPTFAAVLEDDRAQPSVVEHRQAPTML